MNEKIEELYAEAKQATKIGRRTIKQINAR
jgi:hypothetical protein